MATNRSTTIDTETAESIFSEITALQKKLESLRKKVVKLLPAKYGSNLWWEKAEEEADDDIKHGRVYGPFKNADDLLRSLHKEANR